MRLILLHSIYSLSRFFTGSAVLMLMLFSASETFSQTWSTITSLPISVAQHTSASGNDGSIYLFGGWNGSSYNSALYIYNTNTDSWSTGANYPVASRGLCSALGSDGNIYGFGGYSSTTMTNSYRYNPASNTWTTIASMLDGVWEASAVGYSGKLYVIGGEGATSKLQIYNISTNSWSYGANLPVSKALHAATVLNGKIFVTGGGLNGSYSTASNQVLIYDIATDTWTTGSSMTTGRFQSGIATGINNKIYVFGGSANGTNNSGASYSSVEIYDPNTNTWEVGTAMTSALGETSAATYGANAFVIGGYTGSTVTNASYKAYLPAGIPGAVNMLDLDGVNQYAQSSLLSTSVNNFTLEGWINPDSYGSANTILFYNGATTSSGYGLMISNTGVLSLLYGGVTISSTSTTIPINSWSHVALVRNSGTASVYVNGVSVLSSISSSPLTPTNGFFIGANHNGLELFDGQIDDLKFWNTALSEASIKDYMCKLVTSGHPSYGLLEAYFDMDEESGNALFDATVNANDGIIINNPQYTLSSAPIGDESSHNYTSPYTTSITHGNGDVFSVSNLSGGLSGAHVYLINSAPNHDSISNNTAATLVDDHYFGVFIPNGSSNTFDITFDYAGNSILTANSVKNAIASRVDAIDSIWDQSTTILHNNTFAKTITLKNATEGMYSPLNASDIKQLPGSGYALDFDGTDDYVELGNNIDLDSKSFTIECWAKRESNGSTDYFAGQGSISTNNGLHIGFRSSNEFTFAFYANDLNTIAYTDADWHHWACTYNVTSNVRKIYRDGVLVANDVATADYQGSGSFHIGNYEITTSAYFDGKIDEYRIWNTELPQAEVRKWMTRKLDASHDSISSLTAYYRFDKNTGTNIADLAGGNTGTFSSSPAWVVSGAALGDESKYTYGGASLSDTLSNGNQITLSDFASTDGIHLYVVNDTAENSSYPSSFASADSTQYFGVFKVGGDSYDVEIDYTNNTAINSTTDEGKVRGLKRSGGDAASWSSAGGPLFLNTTNNTISIQNQTGTEYVTGFTNASYPVRQGSGYALDFDGSNDYIDLTKVALLQGLTYSAWIKTTSTDATSSYDGNAALNIIGDHTGNVWNGFGIHGGFARYNHYNGSWQNLTGSIEVNDGSWHHIAVSHSETNDSVWLYVDGVLDASSVISYGGGGGALKVGFDRIGGGYSNGTATADFFDGSLDEIGVWSTPLDAAQIRAWMTKKLNSSHDSIANLVAYYRFDENTGTTLFDLAGGNDGALTNSPTWALSGAALGDESKYTYGGTSLLDTLSNNNQISLSNFASADGIHLYVVNDTAENSSYPTTIVSADSTEYFGVFMVGGESYDVEIDYTNNTAINAQSNEQNVRGLKRSGGDDADWETANGELFIDATNNTISILNQRGTEYVTGFANSLYPVRPGSGYALDFDGSNDYVELGSIIPVNSSYTKQAWIKNESNSGARNILSSVNNPFWINSGALSAGNSGNYSEVSFNFTSYLNEWTHVAVTYDDPSNTLKLYVNGVVVDSNTASNAYNSGVERIGAHSTASIFSGSIDEVAIWNTALPQEQLRNWMTKKLNATHDSIGSIIAYYRFDENSGTTLFDLAGGNDGTLNNSPTWTLSGAALGDESKYTYSGTSLLDTLSNNNQISLSDFSAADGIHLYVVNDTAEHSSYPSSISNTDSTEYFGVFMVGGESYDVEIDYSNNTAINGTTDESKVRGLKRAGGDDSTWETASGVLFTNTTDNTISILNQTGTEYVTGFANTSYPSRPGSGYTLDFDGSNDYVQGSDAGFPSGNSARTMMAWMKTTKTGNGSIVEYGNVSNSQRSGMLCLGNRLYFVGEFNDLQGSIIINDGNWHHVAVSHDGDTTKLYVDGMLDVAAAKTLSTSLNYFRIGMRGNNISEQFDGNIDEVSIWSTALDQNQIREWMTKKLNVSHDSINNLLAYYRFDENSGSRLFDLAGGNDGTLINSPTWALSGAALGDESKYTYGGTSLLDTLSNSNQITLSDFNAADGIHLYVVNDTAENSSYPSTISNTDSTEYFGVFMVGGNNYDVEIDYSNNTAINGSTNEALVRGLKRSGGDDTDWEIANGELFTNTTNNTISILNQTGTEYVTGFANTAYPSRPGSGYALDFDGSNDRVVVSSTDAYAFGTGDFTIEMWAKISNGPSTYGHLTMIGSNQSNFSLKYDEPTQRIYIYGESGAYNSYSGSSATYTEDEWNHISLIRRSGAAEFYVNGILKQTFTDIDFANQNFTADLGNIGWGNASEYSDMQFDEYRVWHTALSQAELRDWMTKKINSSHPQLSDLAIYYRFDENTGTELSDLAGGNSGTLTNGPAWVLSGAALGDESVNSYTGTSLSLQETNGDSILINNYNGQLDGIHLYAVNETPNSTTYSGAESADTNYYFGVFKIGNDTTSYDVTYNYANSAILTGSSNEYRVSLATRENNAEGSWLSKWSDGVTDTNAKSVFLPNQTGTEYSGAIQANNALNFDGSNDYVRIDDHTDLSLSDGAFTIEFWAQATNNQIWVISKDAGNSNLDYLIGRWANRWRFIARNLSIDISGAVTNTNQWYHVACVFDGTEARLYVDGVLENTDVTVGSAVNNTADVLLGGRTSSSPQHSSQRM
jgi:N-acetylneuraminic acid mutarotase